MPQKDSKDLLMEVVGILSDLRIPYLITGGMAVLVWGRPRFTADIDVVVEMKFSDIDKLIYALNNFSEFNFIDGNTGIKVDFWVLNEDEFDVSRLKRRVKKKVFNKQVYFSSPEDLILSKLTWFMKSQSSRHIEDIESIFKISGENLDLKYLEEWARKMGSWDLLNRYL